MSLRAATHLQPFFHEPLNAARISSSPRYREEIASGSCLDNQAINNYCYEKTPMTMRTITHIIALLLQVN